MSIDLDKAKRKLRRLGYKVYLRNGLYVVTINDEPVRNGRNKFSLTDLLAFVEHIPNVKQQEMFSYDKAGSLRVSMRRYQG